MWTLVQDPKECNDTSLVQSLEHTRIAEECNATRSMIVATHPNGRVVSVNSNSAAAEVLLHMRCSTDCCTVRTYVLRCTG